jgi:hypothetical protein
VISSGADGAISSWRIPTLQELGAGRAAQPEGLACITAQGAPASPLDARSALHSGSADAATCLALSGAHVLCGCSNGDVLVLKLVRLAVSGIALPCVRTFLAVCGTDAAQNLLPTCYCVANLSSSLLCHKGPASATSLLLPAEGLAPMQNASRAATGTSQRMRAHRGAVAAMAASPAAPAQFVSASFDGTLGLWDLTQGAGNAFRAIPVEDSLAHGRRAPEDARAFTCCAFDVSGMWVIAAAQGGAIVYYSLAAKEIAATASVPGIPTVRQPAVSAIILRNNSNHSMYFTIATTDLIICLANWSLSSRQSGKQANVDMEMHTGDLHTACEPCA